MDVTGLSQLETDDVFKEFLREDLDVALFASQSIQGREVAEQLAKLHSGIALLDKAILDQVSEHYEDLLSQVVGVETLENVLRTMQGRIQSLLAAVERLRTKLVNPYNEIATQTTMLLRLQSACDILRIVIRVMHLSKRLQGQLQGGVKELIKAAQSINELDYLMADVDLSGLEVIEQDQKFIRQARKEVEKQANVMLDRGMETQNQVQVATALHVFNNLGSLRLTVQQLVDGIQRNLEKSVKDALGFQSLNASTVGQDSSNSRGRGGPGKAAMPLPGNTAAFRAALWTNMEKLMDQIYNSCANVQHLQKVLSKIRDPVTHVTFLDELKKEGFADVTQTFWDAVTKVLTNEFIAAAEESTFVKQAFEGEYPKLLRLYGDLLKRLQQFKAVLNVNTSTAPATILGKENGIKDDDSSLVAAVDITETTDFDPEQALRGTLLTFENSYLSRSISRLFDPINVMFSGSETVPTSEDVEACVRAISSELNVASIDAALGRSVAKNVVKTAQLFAVKCEQMLCTGGDASQVTGPPTSGQIRNANIVDLLQLFKWRFTEVVSEIKNNLMPDALQLIVASTEVIETQMLNAINPLLSSVSDMIEAIILTMHNEDFGSPGVSGVNPDQCSLYMKELQSFVARVQSDYMNLFKSKDFIERSARGLAERTLDLFVRHASLVRPLTESGKMRLAADFAQIELCLAPLCPRLSHVGPSYKLLRACRPMLFQTPEHICKSPLVGDVVPFSTALHFLFARAPNEVRSPHQTAGWSLSRYSEWLNEHKSEKERLALIQGALECYVQSVKQRQAKEYAPIYPVMADLVQRGTKSCNS